MPVVTAVLLALLVLVGQLDLAVADRLGLGRLGVLLDEELPLGGGALRGDPGRDGPEPGHLAVGLEVLARATRGRHARLSREDPAEQPVGLLQRVGRAGHAIGAIPKGRLFPLALDDLLECAALLDAVRRGELDRIHVPDKPLDALAQQVVAEEMILWGWRGMPQQKEYLDHAQARDLLAAARASSDMPTPARLSFLDNELKLLQAFTADLDQVAEQQSQKLVEAHERFSSLMDGKRFQVVHPVLPMDLLGVYVLLPE